MYWGLERDTLPLLTGIGFLTARAFSHAIYPANSTASLDLPTSIVLSAMSLWGLIVYWNMLSLPGFVDPKASTRRRILEMLFFWLIFPLYVPIIAAVAAIKTSTSYALGKRPTGHYDLRPK